MNENTFKNNSNENCSGPSHSNLNGGVEDLSNKPQAIMNDKPQEVVQENSTPKKGASTSNANNSTGRSKKRKKCLRDATAPKQPLTGYFRFLNDRREKVRIENPTMPFSEITKQLAAEWNTLPPDQKQHYLDAAEQDKERYNREFNDYKQTEAYRLFLEKQSAEKQNEIKKEKNGSDSANTTTTTSTTPTAAATAAAATTNNTNNISAEDKKSRQEKNNESGVYEIPIFTEEFLDHNKACEAELRQLRKATTDYESQNAVLQRHVDSLHAAVNRLEADTSQHQSTNEALQRHLDMLRSQLASCFSNIPLTGTHDGATAENIDSYIERLDYLVNNNMEQPLRTAIRTAVSHLDFIK